MLIRETKIQECWCGNCAAGQMEQINQILFTEKINLVKIIGRKITCAKCGHENEVEDILILIPTSFLVASQNDINKVKSNQELQNWLNAQ